MLDRKNMSDSIDDLVFHFLNGELSGNDERKALRRIAENPDGRNLLKLEMGLQQTLSVEEGASVPEGFAERTMVAIAEAEAADEARSPWHQIGALLRGWLDSLIRPRPVLIRPAYGLAAALLLFVGIGLYAIEGSSGPQVASTPLSGPQHEGVTGSVQTTASMSPNRTPNLVATQFVYINSQASSVAIAGDFNDWEPQPMQARRVNGETVWTATIPLHEGEHQYMFRVNGERWVTDPLAPVQREDGFGHKNAVIAI